MESNTEHYKSNVEKLNRFSRQFAGVNEAAKAIENTL